MTPERKKNDLTRPKSRKRKPTRDEILRRRVTVLAVVATVLLAFAIGLKLWIREPDVTPSPGPAGPEQETEQQGNLRKEGVYTFLLLGRDTGGGGNTDTMMVVSYDTVAQSVNVMNIYRDTMVNQPWDIKRINSVYGFNGGGEEGVAALKDCLKDLLGFAPDYYITVEWDAVGELVDAIGGVEFDVPYEMHYWDPTQDLLIDQAKGYRTLYGDDAMQIVRWRKNNDGSGVSVGDTGRVSIQQDFLKAVVQKCLKTININTLPKYAQILLNNVTTDIPLGTVVWFGQQALGMDMNNLEFHSMPGDVNGMAWSRTYENMQSYVLPDGAGIVELVNARFNPYEKDIELSDLDIMSVNADGSLSSSRGEVKDAKAAVPPVYPSREPKPEEPAEEPGPEESVTPELPGETEEPAETESPEPTEIPGEAETEQPTQEPQPSEPPAEEPEAPGEGEPPAGSQPSVGPESGEIEIAPEVLPAVPAPAA